MASVYVHLSGRDVDKAILNLYGIEMDKNERDGELLKPKKCLRCGEMNPATNKVCHRCFFPLDEKIAENIMEKEIKMEILNELMDMLWEDEEFRFFFLKRLVKLNLKTLRNLNIG